MTNSIQSLYTKCSVGYLGDYAGVTLELKTPEIRQSSRPDGKYRRKSFDVKTTHHTFNLQSIGTRIEEAPTLGLSDATVADLRKARSELEAFIAQNGNTNPRESVDWAPANNGQCVPQYVFAKH